MTEHSAKFDRVKRYYDNGLWTAKMVRNAAKNPKAPRGLRQRKRKKFWAEANRMSWPDLCERLLSRLEAAGEDTAIERGDFAALVSACTVRGCPLTKKK